MFGDCIDEAVMNAFAYNERIFPAHFGLHPNHLLNGALRNVTALAMIERSVKQPDS